MRREFKLEYYVEKLFGGLDMTWKKVILFAPTFRGNGKNSAYYEKKRFDPNRFIEALPEEYILLIKHHPFVDLTYNIKDRNASRIFDFSDKSEINHLLFITDVMITDYSSVVYEASILDIPMLFYAYDLENYISSRDFYTEYKNFVPGKIVRTQEELVDSILNNDCKQELVKDFCQKNFDIRDGKASITQASCPDLLCVHQGAVSRQGESIICLPNEVVVEIIAAKEEATYDALSK